MISSPEPRPDPASAGTKEETLAILPLCAVVSQFLLPAGLDLDSLAASMGGKKAADKLACVVHQILERGHRDARLAELGRWVPVHTPTLNALLGTRDGPKALTLLTSGGVLERCPRYSAGRFSRSYRIAEPFASQPLVARPIKDRLLAAKLAHEDDEGTQQAVGSHPVRQAVLENLRAVGLRPEAMAYAEARTYRSQAERAAWVLSLRDLSAGRTWLRAHEETGRVFHPLTQCPRELRRFVTINGEPAAEVDIRNAQPFFLLSLYPPDHPERARYAEVVGAGRFYQELFLALGRKDRRSWGGELEAWEESGNTHKDRFKKHVMAHVLYAQLSEAKDTRRVFEALEMLFPWLGEELRQRRMREGGASGLALEMQSAEAGFVLGRVVPRALKELENSKLIPVHDAVLCGEALAQRVVEIMQEEGRALFHTAPASCVRTLQVR